MVGFQSSHFGANGADGLKKPEWDGLPFTRSVRVIERLSFATEDLVLEED